jgi:hypothetical protein
MAAYYNAKHAAAAGGDKAQNGFSLRDPRTLPHLGLQSPKDNLLNELLRELQAVGVAELNFKAGLGDFCRASLKIVSQGFEDSCPSEVLGFALFGNARRDLAGDRRCPICQFRRLLLRRNVLVERCSGIELSKGRQFHCAAPTFGHRSDETVVAAMVTRQPSVNQRSRSSNCGFSRLKRIS